MIPLPDPAAPQRIIKVRRDHNRWVGRETLEAYALRYTPQRFRQWSERRVGNTAFGAASFLILEAVRATLRGRNWCNHHLRLAQFWCVLDGRDGADLPVARTSGQLALHAGARKRRAWRWWAGVPAGGSGRVVLGAETRTAAAAMAINRVPLLQPRGG